MKYDIKVMSGKIEIARYITEQYAGIDDIAEAFFRNGEKLQCVISDDNKKFLLYSMYTTKELFITELKK